MSEKVSTGLDSSIFRGRLRAGGTELDAQPQHSGVLVEPELMTTGVWADVYQAPGMSFADEAVADEGDDLDNLMTESFEAKEAAEPTKKAEPAKSLRVAKADASLKKVKQKLATPWNSSVTRKRKSRRQQLISNGMIGLALLLLVFGFAVAIQTFVLNKQVKDKVSAAPAAPEGQPEEAPAAAPAPADGPDETKPTNVRAYTVPADQPRFVNIPKFNLSARVKAMGVDANNKLIAPGNVHDAGWFQNSAKPGAIGGATLLDGHVSGWTTKGVFYRLKDLVPGDTITVERGDGKVFSYRVVKSQAFDKNAVDMNSAMEPINKSKTGLNLITCSGTYDRASDDYTQRLIVYAEAI